MSNNFWSNILNSLVKPKSKPAPLDENKRDSLDLMLQRDGMGIIDSKGKPWFYEIKSGNA